MRVPAHLDRFLTWERRLSRRSLSCSTHDVPRIHSRATAGKPRASARTRSPRKPPRVPAHDACLAVDQRALQVVAAPRRTTGGGSLHHRRFRYRHCTCGRHRCACLGAAPHRSSAEGQRSSQAHGRCRVHPLCISAAGRHRDHEEHSVADLRAERPVAAHRRPMQARHPDAHARPVAACPEHLPPLPTATAASPALRTAASAARAAHLLPRTAARGTHSSSRSPDTAPCASPSPTTSNAS
jgi:hypothetical protein